MAERCFLSGSTGSIEFERYRPSKALHDVSVHRVLTKVVSRLKKQVNVVQLTWQGGEEAEDLCRALNL